MQHPDSTSSPPFQPPGQGVKGCKDQSSDLFAFLTELPCRIVNEKLCTVFKQLLVKGGPHVDKILVALTELSSCASDSTPPALRTNICAHILAMGMLPVLHTRVRCHGRSAALHPPVACLRYITSLTLLFPLCAMGMLPVLHPLLCLMGKLPFFHSLVVVQTHLFCFLRCAFSLLHVHAMGCILQFAPLHDFVSIFAMGISVAPWLQALCTNANAGILPRSLPDSCLSPHF